MGTYQIHRTEALEPCEVRRPPSNAPCANPTHLVVTVDGKPLRMCIKCLREAFGLPRERK